MSKLDYLGLGRVYGDRGTRDLVVDTDSIRRGEFAGDEEFSGTGGGDDDDWDDDEFGEEVEGDDDLGEELEGDDGVEGEDDFGEEVEGGDFAGKRRQRRPRDREKDRDREPRRIRKAKTQWGTTIVTGDDSFTAAAAGDSSAFNIPIRLQHPFKAQDITFDLTNVSKALVQSVKFGDRDVWSADGNGVNASIFGSTSQLRGLLKGDRKSTRLNSSHT